MRQQPTLPPPRNTSRQKRPALQTHIPSRTLIIVSPLRPPATSILAALALVSTAAASLADWPAFRGLANHGTALQDTVPLHFGAKSNLLWSIPLPPGHGSPCLTRKQIFLTAYEQGQLLLLALNRTTGSEQWRRSFIPGPIEHGAQLGNPATSTPCTDSQSVYVYFGAFGAAAFRLDGRELWRHPLPIPITQHGSGTSPVLAGQRLIINRDQDVGASVLALNAKTGTTLWETQRPWARRGFSTPLIHPPAKPNVVIVPGTLQVAAYNLDDGSERWHVSGLPNEMVSSPVSDGSHIFVAGWTPGSGSARLPSFDSLLAQGDSNHDGNLSRAEAPPGPARQHFAYIDANKDGQITRAEWETISSIFSQSRNVLMAIDPNGLGDVTTTHVRWTQTKGLPYVPTPLTSGGWLYTIRNGGMLSCFNAITGTPAYLEERLGTLGDNYSSPILTRNALIITSQDGSVAMVKPGPALEILAINHLPDPILATPAVMDSTLYIRTVSRLWAFSSNPKAKF